ncbi:MAG TPA: CheR family methyltransferase [Planctomycetaceae bacterium]|jgi:two-component system CheB/CheR fusion protein
MDNSSHNPLPDESDPATPVDQANLVADGDATEKLLGDDLDHVVTGQGHSMTPMVGLGGSAGSILPLGSFFQSMPADSGMAFVVVLHLSPSHESSLAALLGRMTAMPVHQALDGQKVPPNHVYVIPPGKSLATVDGHLRLTELRTERGRRVAVDLFFRSLADTHGSQAAAVVLSGADGDGAIGIKRIKERGGLTIVQDPEEAEYAGMPRASIGTGMIDWVLRVADIPARLLQYRDTEMRLKLPPEDGPGIALAAMPQEHDGEAALRDVLVLLRTRTGCDFSYYKRATILRRVGRRMQINGIEELPAYLTFLRTHPGEAGALLQDLLISVTNFFRDKEAFEALESTIPELFKDKKPSDIVRVWVPACATGEEAYSIAMLLLEYAQSIEAGPTLQVFACDLDKNAIQVARAGHYPEAITADVSDARLRRFFIKDHSGYRVRRELREMVLFADHDLLKDAPFSRMDLISCRNLLIYLNGAAQARVFETFHFSLKPEGRLFLGSSELVEDGNPLFRVLDKKHRLYIRQAAARTGLPVPVGPGALLRAMEYQSAHEPVVHGRRFVQETPVQFRESASLSNLDSTTLADLHFRLLERLSAPSVIVNAEHEIVHLSEHAGRFFQFAGGEFTTNLLRVVHPALRVELRTALFRADETNDVATATDIPMEMEGQPCKVDFQVFPAKETSPGYYLVVFERKAATEGLLSPTPGSETAQSADPVIRDLERELVNIKGRCRDTVEQYEASTEELKASNEELQAMNEELRSATEELETSREELQSINEELTTVNLEMKGKMDELAHTNSDLQNLMASTAIATVFLDRDLAITRYTPTAVPLFNLIPGDLGRPLAHLKHRLEYPEMLTDVEEVLRTLVPIEREVRANGEWYLARVQPYRTLEDHIAGGVLTFVNVTDRKKTTETLRERMEELTRFNAAAVGRETRMIELKNEVNDLCAQLGIPLRYSPPTQAADAAGAPE